MFKFNVAQIELSELMNFVLVLSKLPLKSACLKYRVARNCFVGSNFCDFFHDLQKKIFAQKVSPQKYSPLAKLYIQTLYVESC